MKNKTTAPIHMWVHEPPPSDVKAALQRLARAKGVHALAVMPDVHLATEVCVGTVVATEETLYPQAVGGDIGCGMAAIAFDGEGEKLDNEDAAAKVLALLYERIPFLKHQKPQQLPENLALDDLSTPALVKTCAREGRYQFGTLGRGNHFLEFQEAESGELWLMVHSGSRAMGAAIRDHHLKAAITQGGGPDYLFADSPEGRAYRQDLAWALRYADANRRRMTDLAVDAVEKSLGVQAISSSYISCHHNHVIREEVAGKILWLHRKGAISAKKGELGIIPGSMGTSSYHTMGKGNAAALFSSSHGAGRTMSRAAARRRISVNELEKQVAGVWFDHRKAGRLRDEAPGAYKDITAVMRAQKQLTKIVRQLRPVLSFKGG